MANQNPAAQPVRADLRRDEAIIHSLTSLFIRRPTEWNAFGALVPLVFETHLVLGSEAAAATLAELRIWLSNDCFKMRTLKGS